MVLAHARVEIDLGHERFDALPTSVIGRLEQLVRERNVVEHADLLRLTAGALDAFAERGFDRVDHWEFVPGGWLPLPEPTHRSLAEPVGHLLHALSSRDWRTRADAREFAVRLSGPPRMRADLVVRRVHRERAHSLTIDLFGRVTSAELTALVRSLDRRVTVLRARVVQYETAAGPPTAATSGAHGAIVRGR